MPPPPTMMTLVDFRDVVIVADCVVPRYRGLAQKTISLLGGRSLGWYGEVDARGRKPGYVRKQGFDVSWNRMIQWRSAMSPASL